MFVWVSDMSVLEAVTGCVDRTNPLTIARLNEKSKG